MDASVNALFNVAFVDPLERDSIIHPAVNHLDELTDAVHGMFLSCSRFEDAYEKMHLRKIESREFNHDLCNRLWIVHYVLDREFSAYSFSFHHRHSTTAFLIIPGSGYNQSLAILRKDESNYHGRILDWIFPFGDVFVFIKPNEDCLAIHDGIAKLTYDFIHAYLINQGGSYSAHYIVNTMALVKALKRKYEKVIVLGLSQGGAATLFNALQTEPLACMVASGFTITWSKYKWANFQQVLIPGVDALYNPNQIYQTIARSKTRFFLSFGLQDSEDYRFDAMNGYTRDFFQPLNNVNCVIHDDGHVFPEKEMTVFLRTLFPDGREQ